MRQVNLRPFIRENLDVLFVGCNPPEQSNNNRHYFSGNKSRFFHLLSLSGLITSKIDKSLADETVFGDNIINYKKANFGVVDIIRNVVETKSSKVKVTRNDVVVLCNTITKYKPRFVCVIHSKVKNAFKKYPNEIIIGNLIYGNHGLILKDCSSIFFMNYFPNGNNIADELKIKIFTELKEML